MSPLTRAAGIHELFLQQGTRRLTTGQVWRYCQAHGLATARKTVRDDLERLTRQGLLTRRGPDNGRTYELNRESSR
ncbi:hypothetical protein ACTVZO_05210 [Streptomyces sp. IBSNAI002]|uniref:hypothetical protein n=1 Tax=Streptomyces sp. IBSNAI002 TaxID=3457500 RepID=UPI003FD26823